MLLEETHKVWVRAVPPPTVIIGMNDPLVWTPDGSRFTTTFVSLSMNRPEVLDTLASIGAERDNGAPIRAMSPDEKARFNRSVVGSCLPM